MLKVYSSRNSPLWLAIPLSVLCCAVLCCAVMCCAVQCVVSVVCCKGGGGGKKEEGRSGGMQEKQAPHTQDVGTKTSSSGAARAQRAWR